MRPARLLIVPIALTIAVVATSPAGAQPNDKGPKAPQLVSQLKDGAERSSAAGCPTEPGGEALRVTCTRGKKGLVRYTFKLAKTPRGPVGSTVSATGSFQRSVRTTGKTTVITVTVAGAAQIRSVSISYYAS